MDQCTENNDLPGALLTGTICVGLVISYLPQHLRIIHARSSEGFSPWFLLLGATSSASAMLNLWILQWPLVQCCRVISGKSCAWNLLGLLQVTLQWFLFSILLVLYLIHFPAHLKYCRTLPLPATDSNDALLASDRPTENELTNTLNERTPLTPGVKYTTTPAWNFATLLAWVIFLHLTLLTLLGIALLHFLPLRPMHPLLTAYARFLGTSSTILAITQYAPQLVATYRARLVGALSIGTMLIQVPGSVLFVASLVGREGVEWSTWASYAVTGGMQAALLGMCVAWKRRQRREGVDDFGQPLEATRGGDD